MYKTERTSEFEQGKGDRNRYLHGASLLPGRTWGGTLCPACNALLEYARQRRDRCPHGDNKPFCSNCPIHCHKPEMRQQMRAVMRYAGPRMLLSHPIPVLRHIAETLRRKRRNANAG